MSNIFPISWLAESPKAFRMAYYSIVLGSQTAQAWVLVMLPAGTVTLDSYSLCPFIVDTEKMLPKSPWISLTNKRCLFSSLTHFFFSFTQHPSEGHHGFLEPLYSNQPTRSAKFTMPGHLQSMTGVQEYQSPVTLTLHRTHSAVGFASRSPAPNQDEAGSEPSSGCFPALHSHTNFPREDILSFFKFL